MNPEHYMTWRRKYARSESLALRQHTPDHWPAIHELETFAIRLALQHGRYIPTGTYDPALTDDCPDEHLLPRDDPFELLRRDQDTIREAQRIYTNNYRAKRRGVA